MPYDEFVRELIKPVPGSEGFIKGIVWRGVVNASQAQEMQAAQMISQVFLGTNLKCALVSRQLHQSVEARRGLRAGQRLRRRAAGDQPLRQADRQDWPRRRLPLPDARHIDAKAPKDRAAEATGRRSRQARRTAGWRGRSSTGCGPASSAAGSSRRSTTWIRPPWNADLLDWLAADLVDHGYDLKRTLALIADSRAYQSASVGAPSRRTRPFVFRGPLVKRMSAEQFVDAVAQLTDAWPAVTPDMLKPDGRNQGGQLAAARAAIAGEVPAVKGGRGHDGSGVTPARRSRTRADGSSCGRPST